eukprot:scaffold64412_cov31-Tisochrysis_lutea.AAC.2
MRRVGEPPPLDTTFPDSIRVGSNRSACRADLADGFYSEAESAALPAAQEPVEAKVRGCPRTAQDGVA